MIAILFSHLYINSMIQNVDYCVISQVFFLINKYFLQYGLRIVRRRNAHQKLNVRVKKRCKFTLRGRIQLKTFSFNQVMTNENVTATLKTAL